MKITQRKFPNHNGIKLKISNRMKQENLQISIYLETAQHTIKYSMDQRETSDEILKMHRNE